MSNTNDGSRITASAAVPEATGMPTALKAADVGFPRFTLPPLKGGEVFAMSSHARARAALEFGLSITDLGFNIYVLGEDRSGRMSATMEYLDTVVTNRPRPADWLYLNNFRRPNEPRPVTLPAGVGRKFRDRMTQLVVQLREALGRAFSGEEYQQEVNQAGEKVRSQVAERIEALRREAKQSGMDVVQSPRGLMVVPIDAEGQPADPETIAASEQPRLEEAARAIAEQLSGVNRWAARQQMDLINWVRDFNRQVANDAIAGAIDQLSTDFQAYAGLTRWLIELREDILDHLDIFQLDGDGAPPRPPSAQPESRYGVNLLVDHGDEECPSVVLEANPTYHSLFGTIEYSQVGGILDTDFTMIRAGALHRANGGVLVLRAEALAADPLLWVLLKGALRDRQIRLEELHRASSLPIAGAPRPQPIPLTLNVVLIGAPRWYYAFFSLDPDFQTLFKVKADIDADLDSTAENLSTYGAILQTFAAGHGDGVQMEDEALQRLFGLAARRAQSRRKLTSRFEILEDVITEANQFRDRDSEKTITSAMVDKALAQRRQRNARIEDLMHHSIAEGQTMIDTRGAVVGQVNGLTVRDMGDHAFGAPARITARASIGRTGVTNIERDVSLSGPIQQKGVMVLQGFLTGHFARRFPLSFDCSVTFEQSYGLVEGDSASMAELLAILSDLSGIPLRQDLGITGSVNQRGQAQPIGGVHHKVEGFFRACHEAGPLTGTQGVVIPAMNAVNLIVNDEVTGAVDSGQFHIWPVKTIEQAIQLFTGIEPGTSDGDGLYPADTVYGRVTRQLEAFDRILTERQRSST